LADYEPLTEGLWIEHNPLPDPYPKLIAHGQPSATANVLAWLRGELDPATLAEQRTAPEPAASRPPEPLPEAGPTFQITAGQLDLVRGKETDSDFDRTTQQTLHKRLTRQTDLLLLETAKVGNRYPQLATTIQEYSDLIGQPFDELDVVDLWAVGNALLAQAISFQQQDRTRTITEPLEPAHLALLVEVAGLHGGFILGFPTGLELSNRADDARIGPNIARLVGAPTSNLLAALSVQRKVVSERARKLAEALDAALIASGWDAARVGYTAYATVRNALIAIVKSSNLVQRERWDPRRGSYRWICNSNLPFWNNGAAAGFSAH
jgi:hypothetical protein